MASQEVKNWASMSGWTTNTTTATSITMPPEHHASSPQRAPPRPWKPSFPYAVDYNDHFETPLEAYQDIAPLIDWMHPNKGDITLYDPYYCDGRSAALLRSLGYRVKHEKRDFYEDIRHNTVPPFDALVTNPPYSDTHKERCLDFCASQCCAVEERGSRRFFFLLVPAYVTARAYYRRLLERREDLRNGILYLAPRHEYRYDHPDGTGKATSPFRSLWICGLGGRGVELVLSEWSKQTANQGEGPILYRNLEELEAAGLISTQKRPNPRQRRKRNRHQEPSDPAPTDAAAAPNAKEDPAPAAAQPRPPSRPGAATPPSSRSKYRDETGKRRRRRF